MKVLDISKWQPNVDYQKVKDSGIDGVILRCGVTTYGDMKCNIDSCFEKHYKGFKAVGMPLGVYYYSCANTVAKAKEEAQATLTYIKGKQLEYPIYYDTENEQRQRSLSKQALTDIAKAFCETIENAGYYVGIYASKSWLLDELDMAQLKDYDVWVAQYASKCTYTGAYGMWQYTNTGKVNGISGNVDLSYCYKDYPTIIKKVGLNGFNSAQNSTESDECERHEQTIAELEKSLETAKKALNEQTEKLGKIKNIIG